MKSTLTPGLTGEVSNKVVSNQLVSYYHPLGPPVYGSPFMLMAMEFAAAKAISEHLDPDEQSVGVEFQFAHLAATPAGATVVAKARVQQVEGQRITFEIEAHDGHETIGRGTHVRHVVVVERFLKRLGPKKAD